MFVIQSFSPALVPGGGAFHDCRVNFTHPRVASLLQLQLLVAKNIESAIHLL